MNTLIIRLELGLEVIDSFLYIEPIRKADRDGSYKVNSEFVGNLHIRILIQQGKIF